jgi:DNA-binding transcriptional ArsR family regulator
VSSFNHLEDGRNRPAEFDTKEGVSASALLDQLGATIQEASQVLSRLTEADLIAPYEIQGYKVTGLYAVYQVVEHFGMHYGQILYITKTLSGKDLGFYSDLKKTGRAS